MLLGSEVAAGTGVPFSPVVGEKAVGIVRRDLTHSVMHVEHGKPASLPSG